MILCINHMQNCLLFVLEIVIMFSFPHYSFHKLISLSVGEPPGKMVIGNSHSSFSYQFFYWLKDFGRNKLNIDFKLRYRQMDKIDDDGDTDK